MAEPRIADAEPAFVLLRAQIGMSRRRDGLAQRKREVSEANTCTESRTGMLLLGVH